jgi:hypothetical protein
MWYSTDAITALHRARIEERGRMRPRRPRRRVSGEAAPLPARKAAAAR